MAFLLADAAAIAFGWFGRSTLVVAAVVLAVAFVAMKLLERVAGRRTAVADAAAKHERSLATRQSAQRLRKAQESTLEEVQLAVLEQAKREFHQD